MANDGFDDSTISTVTITSTNSAPVAEVGPGQTALIGETVYLDVSGSADVDGDRLSYQWSMRSSPAGSTASLSDASALTPDFVVDQAGAYLVELTVSDGRDTSLPDIVDISTLNTLPVADAGFDQTLTINDTASMNGSGSSDVDGDPLTFSWSFVSKPTSLHVPGGSLAALDFPDAFNPSFTADLGGSYIAQLIVKDGSLSSQPDTVVVSSFNVRPIASAGLNQSVSVAELVQLIGIDSHDANADPLNYHWSISQKPVGSSAVLSDQTLSNPTFSPDLAGLYLLQLIVSDGTLDSPPDTVGITVKTSQPVVADFSPKSASSGDLITVTGSNLKALSGASKVTLSKQGGGTISAPVGSTTPIELTFTIPPGAATGTISVDVSGKNVSSASALSIVASNDFTLNTAPASANLIKGESVAYTVSLNSVNGFSQLSALSISGLPAGMTASFKPAQITTGQSSLLTLTAPATQAIGTATLTILIGTFLSFRRRQWFNRVVAAILNRSRVLPRDKILLLKETRLIWLPAWSS